MRPFKSTAHMANQLNNNGPDVCAVRLTEDKRTPLNVRQTRKVGEGICVYGCLLLRDINGQLSPKLLSFV